MNIANAQARSSPAPSILLVDDEKDILPEYQDFLELAGFDSLTCFDPEQAVRMVVDSPSISLVITDLRMAKLDGISLIRRLGAMLPPERQVEFIILTGDASAQLSEEISHIPVLFKPTDTHALISEIESALARIR